MDRRNNLTAERHFNFKKMEQLLYNDEKSARFVEGIKGWVDKDGRFFGNDKLSEHMARYSSCTHIVCGCGEIMPKGWTK